MSLSIAYAASTLLQHSSGRFALTSAAENGGGTVVPQWLKKKNPQ